MRSTIAIFVTGLSLAGADQALAQPASDLKPKPGAQQPAKDLNTADREFLNEVGRMRIGEVETSELAIERSQSPDVKQVAEAIISYHRRIDPMLEKIASSNGIVLPRALDKDRATFVKDLKQKRAGEFDRFYIEGQKSDHELSVTLFRKAAQTGNDPELKAFANERLNEADRMKTAVDTAAAKIADK